MMKKRYVIVLAVLLLAGVATAVTMLSVDTGGGGGEASPASPAPAPEPAVTETVFLQPASARRDDAFLRDFASDIWLGEIVSGPVPDGIPGSEPGAPGIAMSVYEVRVLRTIKGDLTGTVRVAQVGGVEDGVLVIAEGDALMEPGRRYFLLTKTNPDKDWETVISPGYANFPVRDKAHERALEARFGGGAYTPFSGAFDG